MPITEIVRVLAESDTYDGRVLELLYDVDGSAKSDEDTVGWPRFWIRERRAGRLEATHGPFDDEDEAVDFAVGLGSTRWRDG